MTARRKVLESEEDLCLCENRLATSSAAMIPLTRASVTVAKNPFSSEFDLDAFTKTHQYLIITGVLFFFTLLYGYLQELVAIHLFARQYGVFLTLVQFMGYTAFASFRRFAMNTSSVPSSSSSALPVVMAASSSSSSSSLGGGVSSPLSPPKMSTLSASSSLPSLPSLPSSLGGRRYTVPMSYCVGLAVSQAAMQSLSNLAMRYLNYPAKVMFKSCRVIPTMLFGVLVYKKKYSRREWLAMVLLVLGLVAFTQADIHSGPAMDPIGIALILASLVLDAGIINVQDHLFAAFGSDEDEVVFVSYAGGCVLLTGLCVVTGELGAAISFINESLGGATGVAAVSLVCFAACGYLGVMCVVALTRRFGALVAALTTTARKALTVVLSFVLFPKPITAEHIFGAGLFLVGITLKATAPRSHHHHHPIAANGATTGGGGGGAGEVAATSASTSTATAHHHLQQRSIGSGAAASGTGNGAGIGGVSGLNSTNNSGCGGVGGVDNDDELENGGKGVVGGGWL